MKSSHRITLLTKTLLVTAIIGFVPTMMELNNNPKQIVVTAQTISSSVDQLNQLTKNNQTEIAKQQKLLKKNKQSQKTTKIKNKLKELKQQQKALNEQLKKIKTEAQQQLKTQQLIQQENNQIKQIYGFNFVDSNSVAPSSVFAPSNPDHLKSGDGAWLISDNNLAIYTRIPDNEAPLGQETVIDPQQYNYHLVSITDIQTNAAGIQYAYVTDVSNPNSKIKLGWVILSQLKPAVKNANNLIRPVLDNNDSAIAVAEVSRGALNSINEIRGQHGLSPLTIDEDLNQIAQSRSQQIVSHFSHYDSNGNSIATQAEINQGILGGNNRYVRSGENISIELSAKDFSYYMIGYQSNFSMAYADATDSNWGHRDNILNAAYTNIGIAVHYDQATNEFYVAYEFAGVN